MQMVMCDKCGKPIDHTHDFVLIPTGAEHLSCNNPKAAMLGRRAKTLPEFVCKAPQKNAV